ncbi:methionyl-tRNA formyltransferase [bacterium SCSIO 12741]|nr:methionyl-tRNA formyltransferase [bacterium SCSIO 12741]
MRIVFLGTPDFAVASLRALVEAKKNVVGVITAPDRPAGRGHKLRPSAVKEYAQSVGLPLLQPTNLKDPEFQQALKDWQADLQIVVAFRMLPESVWNMPAMGTFNLHASLLPQYRGAAPINRAVMNGESESGVTTFLLQHAIDTGNILFREKENISPDDTAGDLHDRLMDLGASLVVKTVDALENGKVTPRHQDEFQSEGEVLREAPKLFKEDCQIDWNRSAQDIHNHIRGLAPFPGAFTRVKVGDTEKQLKVYSSIFEAQDDDTSIDLPQQLSEKDRLGVRLSGGILWLTQIQLEGKKRMPVADLLRGLNDQPELLF